MDTKQRVEALLQQMSIEEKVAQLSCTMPLTLLEKEEISEVKLAKQCGIGLGRMTQFASGFLSGAKSAAKGYNAIQKYHVEKTRLGIPVLIQNETAAGLVAAQASIFPVPISVASTWKPSYAKAMGQIMNEEARAIGVRKGLSPVADVARDSRWGRVGETFGEDTTLVTQFSINQVQGLQGDSYQHHIISCAKHFMGYGASECGINTAVINMGRKELYEVYGTPFHGMIQDGNLQSVMVTYSEIDGLPMSVNKYYMQKVLREDMGFTGSAICDAMSIPKSHNDNGIGKDLKDIAMQGLKAGVDADTPITSVYQYLVEAVKNKELDESYVDEAVARMLTHKFELGLFEHPYIDEEQAEVIFNRPEGKQLSAKIAEDAMILLKNNGVLPLAKQTKKIALIGPFANRLSTLFGGYAYPSFLEMFVGACSNGASTMEGISEFFGKLIDKEDVAKKLDIRADRTYEENLESYLRNTYHIHTLLEEMKESFTDTSISFARGCSNDEENDGLIAEAMQLAKDNDVIILTLGEVTGFGKDATSGEGINNYDLNLPGHQEELLKAVCAMGKPVILVLFNGRPLTINFAAEHCDAIIEAWYPASYGAKAIAKAISGEVNPGGKLPITFPRSSAQCPIYYAHKSGSGYRPNNMPSDKKMKMESSLNAPLYHFGHGLSYTTFSYSDLQLQKEVQVGDTLQVSLKVMNTGTRSGDETVQVYIHTKGASVTRPVMEMKAFERIHLNPSEEKTIVFKLDTRAFGYYNADDNFVIEPCATHLMIGSSSLDIRLEDEFDIIGAEKEILHDRVFTFETEVK